MRYIRVTLVTPDGMSLSNTELPAEMLVEEVIAELKDELNLPEINEKNEKIIYTLSVDNRRQILQTGKSLNESGIEDGDSIRMISSLPASEASENLSPPALPEVPHHGDGEIELLLSVVDLNRSEQIRLSTELSVTQLIDQIADRYPALSKNGNSRADYALYSKYLGRYLLGSETLKSAEIPGMDRISLHRQDIAGGGYGG